MRNFNGFGKEPGTIAIILVRPYVFRKRNTRQQKSSVSDSLDIGIESKRLRTSHEIYEHYEN